MDSITTIIQQIVYDTLALDSLNYKLTALQNIIAKQQTSSTYSIWIPFLSAVTGGLLVLAGQFIDRQNKLETETQANLREIYAFSRKLEVLMKSNFRELAMAKVHVEYWWYCNQTTPDGPEKQKFYDEHLRSQAFAREIERRIGETKADFIGQIRKFQVIKELKPEIETQLAVISDLTNTKAKTYDTKLQHEKVRYEIVINDENELRNMYYTNLRNFKAINDYLQTLL